MGQSFLKRACLLAFTSLAGGSLAAPQKGLCCKVRVVAKGFAAPTFAKFVPGLPQWVLVGEKSGKLFAVHRQDSTRILLTKVAVKTPSEQGLLDLAFLPGFDAAKSTQMVLSYSTVSQTKGAASDSVIQLAKLIVKDKKPSGLSWRHEILRVAQPYSNHNGGGVEFGPDGFLYFGLGDGGKRDDPDDHGQNTQTLLATILRLDLKGSSAKEPYAIPEGNLKEGRREIFAYGLRNPWRFSFLASGQLVAADVGQDEFEELNIVAARQNYGWPLKEGSECYLRKNLCKTPGLVDPFLVYPHSEGSSITGGYEYLGSQMLLLKGQYIFGDFVSGRVWSVDPQNPKQKNLLVKLKAAISSFARDPQGEIYVVDYAGGRLLKLVPRPL